MSALALWIQQDSSAILLMLSRVVGCDDVGAPTALVQLLGEGDSLRAISGDMLPDCIKTLRRSSRFSRNEKVVGLNAVIAAATRSAQLYRDICGLMGMQLTRQ